MGNKKTEKRNEQRHKAAEKNKSVVRKSLSRRKRTPGVPKDKPKDK